MTEKRKVVKLQIKNRKQDVGKHCVVVQRLEFPVGHCAFGLISPKEELGKIQVCFTATNLASSRQVDVREANGAGARRSRDEAL